MLYSLWSFFSSKRKKRDLHETCVFSWQRFILRSCPFSLKHWLKNSQPGVHTQDTNSPVFLLLFCQCHFAVPLCAVYFGVCLSVPHFVLLLNSVRRWGRAEGGSYQPETGRCCRAREGSGAGRTWQHLTNLVDSRWTFWIWKKKVTWACKGEGAWDLSLSQGNCGSELWQPSVCLPCGARVNPKFPRLEISFC